MKQPKPDPRKAHMERRKAQGLTYADLAKEFKTSKTTAHRKLKAQSMRQGFDRMGGA